MSNDSLDLRQRVEFLEFEIAAMKRKQAFERRFTGIVSSAFFLPLLMSVALRKDGLIPRALEQLGYGVIAAYVAFVLICLAAMSLREKSEGKKMRAAKRQELMLVGLPEKNQH